MKRIISFAFLIFSLCMILITASYTTDRQSFHDFRMTADEAAVFTSTRKPSDRDLIISVSFNDQTLFFDERSSSWFYSVDPADPDIDPLVSFRTDGDNISILFGDDIQPGKTISLTAFSDTEYREYHLAVTTLPLIRIESTIQPFLADNNSRDDYPIHFTLIDNRPDAVQSMVVSDGKIHMRGWSSKYFDKKGYRLTLFEKGVSKKDQENLTPILGLRSDGDWILYAAYNDQEKVRNVFSTNLWLASCGSDNSFGLINGNEYRFAELFVNQEYWGLYAIGYPIDSRQMNIQPDYQGHFEEFLFKQKEWGPVYKGENADYGGMWIMDEMEDSNADFGYTLLRMFFESIMAEDPESLWNTDISNAIDIWLFMKLIQAADSVRSTVFSTDFQMKNMICTIKTTGQGRKIIYTPWDMDISWGNTLKGARNFTLPYASSVNDNTFEMRLNPISILWGKDPEIDRQVRERYSELRTKGWSDDAVNAMLDGFEQDIFGSGAYIRDMERWPKGSYQDPELKLTVFRTFVLNRLSSMDKYILGSAPRE